MPQIDIDYVKGYISRSQWERVVGPISTSEKDYRIKNALRYLRQGGLEIQTLRQFEEQSRYDFINCVDTSNNSNNEKFGEKSVDNIVAYFYQRN